MTVRGWILVAMLAAGCAADDGRAPDEPGLPVVQAAEGIPYCTTDAQCEAGQTCAETACVGAPDSHPCEDVTSDPYNCGACGNRCPWGESGAIGCTDGVCYGVGSVGGVG